MTISPLTNYAFDSPQKSSRNGARVDHFIVHHAVSTNWRSVLNLMMGAKEVSANYIIGNAGEIVSVVPEEFRAWTSSSSEWDGRSITVEVCNESLDPASGYAISAAAQNSLTKLIGDVGRRYGFTPTRAGQGSTVLGHRDLYNWWGDSYATACPGDYLYGRLNGIVQQAANPAPVPPPVIPDTIAIINRKKNQVIYAFIRNPGGGIILINGETRTYSSLTYPEWAGYEALGYKFANVSQAQFDQVVKLFVKKS